MKTAFIGGGNMGRAILGGLIDSGAAPGDFRVGEKSAELAAALRNDFGVSVGADNLAAVRDADLVVLAVKPQVMHDVIVPLASALQARRPVVLSVAAGIRVASLQAWCGPGVPIVRAMPNRPALVRAGATGLFAAPDVSAQGRELAETAMRALGLTVWVPDEDAIDIVTALSGSGPAYFFLLAELMAESAERLGLAPATARALATATLHGAGTLARASDGDLARLRIEVTSPGGTTEAALRSLDAAGLRDIVHAALDAATGRGRELAAQFGSETPRAP